MGERRGAGDTLAPGMDRAQLLPPVLAHGDPQARSALVLAGALIGLATWLIMVYYAGSHPQWGHSPARRHEIGRAHV